MLQFTGDCIGNEHLVVQSAEKLDLFYEHQVVDRRSVGDDDHRAGVLEPVPKSSSESVSRSRSRSSWLYACSQA